MTPPPLPAAAAAAASADAADWAASARRNAAMRIRSLLSDSSLSRPAPAPPLLIVAVDPLPPLKVMPEPKAEGQRTISTVHRIDWWFKDEAF